VSRRLVISLGNLREAWVEVVDDDDLLDALAAALAAGDGAAVDAALARLLNPLK
jgi:hypothetical protein